MDGYYYRDTQGKVHGPLDDCEFEELQARGLIHPGMKIWRQQAGSAFRVTPKRKVIVGRVFSARALSQLCELVMILFALGCLLFAFSLPKLREELSESWGTIVFFMCLAAVTISVTLFSIYKMSQRLQDASTEVYCDEV
mmetsp:Transcript_30140/g.87790  ORF Transcript_30140/g.87790 Transcript_30140/m.87790 type:complete len:139 (+) Transcript_30140:100-516(+)|eukprot:CAMPEP_0118998662 /NCGR_PEP_ID=MMETSP1173-20130426/63190_1 /TAXON_ID=1034831 /ORGANISM="Rhizochromulina marina cf, Strain CCMP1243" /LENGTH=138 /DNA_ID=CAMNT_0006950161 /DNA_START=102 /DNA_END=518 /DNA_ORIENTATION=+